MSHIVIPFMDSIIHLGHYGHFTWINSNIKISRQNSSLEMPLTKYQLSINKSNFTKESVAEQADFNIVCGRRKYSSVLRKSKKASRFPQSILRKRIRHAANILEES